MAKYCSHPGTAIVVSQRIRRPLGARWHQTMRRLSSNGGSLSWCASLGQHREGGSILSGSIGSTLEIELLSPIPAPVGVSPTWESARGVQDGRLKFRRQPPTSRPPFEETSKDSPLPRDRIN